MSAGSVPVALHGFGVKGDNHAKLLSHTVQNVAGDPEMVSHIDAFTGAHLELPLDTQTDIDRMLSHANIDMSTGGSSIFTKKISMPKKYKKLII